MFPRIPRIQFPAGFTRWRVVGMGCAAVLVALGFLLLNTAVRLAAEGATLGSAGPAVLAIACYVLAAILAVPSLIGVFASPVTRFFDALFYPSETITQPPAPLLFSLRMRLRDRQWEPVTQQLDALTVAYGTSAELLHLRAHLVAGQTGEFKTVTDLAIHTLSSADFDYYTALVLRDPPPDTIQTGIEA